MKHIKGCFTINYSGQPVSFGLSSSIREYGFKIFEKTSCYCENGVGGIFVASV